MNQNIVKDVFQDLINWQLSVFQDGKTKLVHVVMVTYWGWVRILTCRTTSIWRTSRQMKSVFGSGAEVGYSRPGLVTSHPAVARQQQYQLELSAAAKKGQETSGQLLFEQSCTLKNKLCFVSRSDNSPRVHFLCRQQSRKRCVVLGV